MNRIVQAMGIATACVLAGCAKQPEAVPHAGYHALVELEALRRGRLTPAEDVEIGVALVDLYERRLGDPGRAMTELRRLIDLHPGHASARRLRRALADLKDQHVPTEPV